jgi:hypothetical protein
MAEFGNYLEGDQAADIRRQLETHLAHCRTCQVFYDSTCKTVKIVTDSGAFDLPDTAAKLIGDEIMARIRKIPHA